MSPTSIQRLRGFKDTFGDESLLITQIEKIARETFGLFDFEEIRLPILEEKTLFSRALGTETDVVQKEMYEFQDRSDVWVALRPEGTASVVRAYLENKIDKINGQAKYFYLGPMFRSERPQAGRLRQFHQIGVEQLGFSSPQSDAETILCLTTFLTKLGITGFRVKLNNLGTVEDRNVLRERLASTFKSRLDEFCIDCKKRYEKNVFRLLDCKVPECRAAVRRTDWIETGKPLLGPDVSKESYDHFEAVCASLKTVNCAFEIDPFMVRGLDYYTKTVFEVTHPNLGSQDALAAGGRYDNLIETFGGQAAGAVGFAIGIERLILSTPFTREAKTRPIFIAALGEDAFRLGFVVLNALRRLGIPAIMETRVRSLKSQLRVAEKRGIRYVVLLGEEEIAKKIFVLKDMQAASEETRQVEYDLDSLMERFLLLYRTEYAPDQTRMDFHA